MALVWQENYSLQAHHTMGCAVFCRWWVELHHEDDLPGILADARLKGLPLLVLGGGSNILLTQDFPGVVLHIALQGYAVRSEDAQALEVAVAAGENWHEFVLSSLAQSWFGLENLALIPGTVGAAPVQNIGAYGLELAERLLWVRCWDRETAQWCILAAETCQLAYRDSLFKRQPGRYIIVEVGLRLLKQPDLRWAYADLQKELAAHAELALTPMRVAQAVMAVRQRKLPDPQVLGNAGSFFKNPVVSAQQAQTLQAQYPDLVNYPLRDGQVKLAAGWLIDRAGLKGMRLGQAGVYERQALVLVNHGGASGQQVWALAQQVQQRVLAQFGVLLEPEPLVLGSVDVSFALPLG